MNQVLKKDRPANKFSKIEIAVDDEAIPMKLTEESLKNIRQVSDKKNKPNIFDIFYRVGKMFFSSVFDIVKFVGAGFYRGLKFLFSRLVLFSQYMAERRENAEVLLDTKIRQREYVEKEKLMNEQVELNHIQTILEAYESEVKSLFFEVVEKVAVNTENKRLETVKRNIEIQIQIMEIIAKKINDTKMVKNIKSISVSSFFQNEALTNRMVIGLEQRGHVWAIMFGKNIIPDLNNLLKKGNGSVTFKHIYNTMRKTDEVHVLWNFKSFDQIKEDEVPAVNPLQSSLRSKSFKEISL